MSMEDMFGTLDKQQALEPPGTLPTPAGQTSPLDSAFDLLDRDKKLRATSNLTDAQSISPDTAAEALKTSRALGIPVPAVEENLDEARQSVQLQDNVSKLDNSPKVTTFLADNPLAARMVQDDLDNLTAMEKLWGAAKDVAKYAVSAPGAPGGGILRDVEKGGRAVASGVPQAGAALYGVAGAFGGLADQIAQVMDDVAAMITGTQRRQILGTAGPESFFLDKQKQAQQTAAAWMGLDPKAGFAERAVLSGLQSAGQTLLTMPLGFAATAKVTGETMMLGTMGLMTAGQSYGKGREAGLNPTQAIMYATQDALAEMVTERYLGAAGLLRGFKAGAPAAKLFAYEIIKEVPGEMVATLWQNFNEWANINPDKSIAEFIDEQPEALRDTIIATLAGGTAQIGSLKLIEKAMSPAAREAMRAEQANSDAAMMTELDRLTEASKLRERDPESFNAFVKQLAEDGPVKELFISGDELMQSGINMQELAALVPSMRDQIQSIQAGKDLTIPVEEYMTSLAGTNIGKALIPHLKTDVNGMSQTEAKTATEQAGEFIKTESERVLKQAQDQVAWQQSVDVVKNTILQQLNKAASKQTEGENEVQATLTSQLFATMAERTGMTPEQMYQKYPLRVAGQMPGQVGADLVAQAERTPDQSKQQLVDSGILKPLGKSAKGMKVYRAVAEGETTEGPRAAGSWVTPNKDIALNVYAKGDETRVVEDYIPQRDLYEAHPEGWLYAPAGTDLTNVVRSPGLTFGQMLDQGVFNQGPRATFSPSQLLITLGENSDLTSFVHELGHFALEVMADISTQPNAPQQIADDMSKLLGWFGITGSEDVRGGEQGGALGQDAYAATADKLDRALTAMGFTTRRESSRVSSSEYLYAKSPDYTEDEIGDVTAGREWKIRVSDHELPPAYEAADLDVIARPAEMRGDAVGDWVQAVEWLAEKTGIEPRGNAKKLVAEYKAATARRQALEREARDRAQQAAEARKPEQEKFRAWVSALPDGAKITVSNKGIVRAEYGGGTSEYGPKPYGFSKSLSTKELAARYYQGGEEGTRGPLPPGRTPLEVWRAMSLEEKRPYHEKLAESFEQYALEGKAPSQELKPVFRRLRSWFLRAYTSLKAFMTGRNLQLNDEIRQVFDRMIATDEQIRQAEEAAGMLPDFDATNDAIEKLQEKSLRDLKWTLNARSKALKNLTKQAKSLRAEVMAEVRAEVDQMQEMKADTALKDFKKTNDRVPNDLEMAMIAEASGYETADSMLQAIDAFGKKQDVIDSLTDQRMLEKYGEFATPEAIEEAATEAVHNEARARALATELKAQSDAMNPRKQTGTDVKGRPLTVNALVSAARQFAQDLTARRKVKDLKNATYQHLAAERRAAKRWQEATAKGETQEALQAKRDQLLNNYTAKAMQEAQEEVKKITEFFRKITKGSNEKIVKGGRDADVVNAMRAVLAAYDIAPRLEKGALEYMEAVSRNDPSMYNALAPGVQTAISTAKPLDQMTMEELRGLHDEMRAMWDLAKRSRQMEVDGNLMDIEDAAGELVARMQAIGIPETVPGEKGSITPGEEAGIKLQFAKAILSRVEQWAERMDGKFGGPFLKLVFQPIKEAADRYRADRVTYRKEYTELVKKVGPFLPPGPVAAPELGYTFGNARDSGMAEIQHAILHTGNESNMRKLLLGRGWATENPDGTVDTRRWDSFIARLKAEGKLKAEHYDFAQGVWDLLEKTKPLAQKTHREVFGLYFDEVTADSFTDPFGHVRRGGYVPAQTDSRLVKDAKLRELAEGENESMAYAFPSSPSGFTKSRVEYNKPLLLDLRTLAQHLDKVLLFSHMQGAVTDVRRLLTQKDVSRALDRINPGAYEGMLIPWLNRSAKQIVETPIVGDRKLSRFMSAARSRAGMALMMGNISNTVQQITGFSMAAVKVKPSLMLKAAGEFARSPKAMKESVAESSEFMKNRMLNEVAAMNNVVEEILVNPSKLDIAQAWTQKHAYFMQSAIDNTMSPIIWTAAYNQAVEQGQDHKNAVRFADGTVRQTQGATLPEDISRFESGPATARIFTQFIGYFNMMANTNATAMKQIADEMGLKRGAGKLLYVALVGLMVPIWVAESIALAFRGGPDDEDDDGYIDDWLAAVFGVGTLRGLTAQVPIVGQGAQLVANRFNDNPADDKFSMSPAVSLIESAVSAPASVYKAIVDDGNIQKAVRDVAAAATMLTGLPFYAIGRPAGYAAGVAQGKTEPTSEDDFIRGLATGMPSKESKQ